MESSQEKSNPASAAQQNDSISAESLSISFGSLCLDSTDGASASQNQRVSCQETQNADVTCAPGNLTRFRDPVPYYPKAYRSNVDYSAASTCQNQSIGCQGTQDLAVTCLPRNRTGLENLVPYYPQTCSNTGDYYNLGHGLPLSTPRFQYQSPDSAQAERIMALATDKQGSLYLQSLLLSTADRDSANIIFLGVIKSIFRLMTDPYGYRVFTRLIDVCNAAQLRSIILQLSCSRQEFLCASRHQYGSRSICWLIKLMDKVTLANTLVLPICLQFFPLMTDQYGSKVVLKCAEVLPEQYSVYLYGTAIERCLQVACQRWGCISLKHFIEHVKGPFRDKLLLKIVSHSLFLSQDPYGNYVIQKVLDLCHPVISESLCSQLMGHYADLAMRKVGSHVVQKCLESRGMNLVVEDLLRSSHLMQVARHPYGNYVVQTALKETRNRSPATHWRLVEKLRPNLDALRSGYGKNIFLQLTAGEVTEEVS